MERVAYIDGDILPYRVGFACQRTVYSLDVEGLVNASSFYITTSKRDVNQIIKENPTVEYNTNFIVEEPLQALNTLKLTLQGIIKGAGCEKFKVVISGDINFREEIATIQKYKGNRDNMVKPVHWEYLRNWLKAKPYTIVAEGEEADDVISRAIMEGHVGCTIDKDLDNTPGWHYNFNKGELYEVSELDATKNFYKQMLVGDKADHIPGVKGIGPKKAGQFIDHLENAEDIEESAFAVYKDKFGYEAAHRFLEVGRLLWMRRQENEMWYPLFMGGPTTPTYDDAS